MRVRFFRSKKREAAMIAANSDFDQNMDDTSYEITNDGEEAQSSLAADEFLAQAEEVSPDASYVICYESDGVYLEVTKERPGGKKLESDKLMNHLSRKKISGLDLQVLQALMSDGEGRTMIAPTQEEYICGESISIGISDDELKASAILFAPDPGGALLDVETVKQKLAEAGVTYGIDEQALTKLLEAKDYGHPGIVAEAMPPEDGVDGILIFNFSTDERTGCPKEISGDRVDYRSLDIFVPVEEGQLLVTRKPATMGTPGISVRGRELAQKPGKEISLPKGKNVVINEDRTEMVAQFAGMVEFINNSVNVSSVYNVKGDCDISVGDIDFDGSVNITGSVRSGHTIKATGGVVVGGSVEAATIIAGGNVEVKGGMQGADKGLIEAGGSVSILYVERGIVHADGPVTFDVSMHSTIETGDTLTAKGKRGAIIGGRVGSSGNIIANYVGAVSNARTEVIVGVMPRKRTRLLSIEKELAKVQGEQVNLDKMDAYLAKSKSTMAPERWELLRRSSVENRQLNKETLEDLKAEKESLEYELEHATDGRIHVLDTVFSGSRVLIGSDTYIVNDEISFVSFKYKDKQVVYGPCEMSKSR